VQTMTAIPRYRSHAGPVILSAGFRPFFLGASIWAAAAIPLWLGAYAEGLALPTKLAPPIWHTHEMVFGYAAAAVAGFLLTAISNWTGRMPLQGGPLAALVLLWVIGRLGVLLSAEIGAPVAAVADLCFPAVFLAVVAREILSGKNWRNLPMLGALSLLLLGNLLVHIDALDLADTAELGNRIGLATLFMLIGVGIAAPLLADPPDHHLVAHARARVGAFRPARRLWVLCCDCLRQATGNDVGRLTDRRRT
jgi:uncharacterized protein involved in response to NO